MFRSSHHEALLEKGCTLIYEKLPPPPLPPKKNNLRKCPIPAKLQA